MGSGSSRRYEACEEADLVRPAGVVHRRRARSRRAVTPNLVSGDVVVLHETPCCPGDVPAGVDVVRLAPWASRVTVVRDEFEQGRGVPVFASVVRRRVGERAGRSALAYARASGRPGPECCPYDRRGVHEARVDAESRLMRGGVLPLVRAAFDALVASGCPARGRLSAMRARAPACSPTTLAHGDLDAELAAARTAPAIARSRAIRCRPRRCSSGPDGWERAEIRVYTEAPARARRKPRDQARRAHRRGAEPRHRRGAGSGLRDPALQRCRPSRAAGRDRRRRRDPGAERDQGRRRGARRRAVAQGRRPGRRRTRQRRRRQAPPRPASWWSTRRPPTS